MAKVEIETVDGQSVYDLAIQYYGSVDGTRLLIELNPDKVNYNDKILAGTILVIDDTKIINKKVVELFATEGVLPPATTYLNLNGWCFAYGVFNPDGVWVDSEMMFDN